MKPYWSRAVSSVWNCVNRGARVAYRTPLLKPVRPEAGRVISVGNIQAGGTGKTPMVAFLAREAITRGKRVAVLSRGYGGVWERSGGVIPPGQAPADPKFSGDEPALLHELVPEAAIAVGAKRLAQYQELLKRGLGPFDLVILDDGFQHFKIERDLDLVLIHSSPPEGAVFRESASALEDADLVIWTKGEKRPEVGSRPLVRVQLQVPSPRGEGKYLWVAGIADPSHASAVLGQSGYLISDSVLLPDHHAYSAEEVLDYLDRAKTAGLRLLLTGKDWVKWRALGIQRNQVDVVEPEVSMMEGKELWEFVVWGSPSPSR